MMYAATRTPERTERMCNRCGLELNSPRSHTELCHSCRSVEGSNSERSIKRSRQIAASEGWNWDQPHLGSWGKAA